MHMNNSILLIASLLLVPPLQGQKPVYPTPFAPPCYYGHILPDYLVRITLLNGNKIYLPVVRTYPPATISPKAHFQIDLQLNKDALTALRQHAIDKIGLFWETGYEEYDIRYVDVLRNQAMCLHLSSPK